ncbi:MAG: ABC-ATPase domain-containing protein [Methanoculleaceae archaeon]
MPDRHRLSDILRRIDGRGYPAYREIAGTYRIDDWTLHIDHVQGDPFAAPSRARVRVPLEVAGFPEDTYRNRSREIALRDFLARSFGDACRRIAKGNRGSGKSGMIAIETPGQEILETTAVLIREGAVEARFTVGLPAFGRRIAGGHAERMLCGEVPAIIGSSLFSAACDRDALYRHIEVAEDADALRRQLPEHHLVAFIADGSILPRRSGIDHRPMEGRRVVPFVSPPSLRVVLETPNRGEVAGMGVPEGVTLIVGGGYHGKTTLLSAIERGVYNHVPGDGREFVVTRPNAVKIRAEDGRRIEKDDISPFINNLPFGIDTRSFSTEDASGSTSQAANIVEALEAGTDLLLIDEDTSATNFMIRDHRMQELVAKDFEPITPFIDRVRQLFEEVGVSSILVIGGSGEYFDVADCVICMREFRPYDVTSKAREISRKYRSERTFEGGGSFGKVQERCPDPGSFNPARGKRQVKITAKGEDTIVFGRTEIDLSAVSQIVHPGQTRAIGDAIYYALRYMDGRTPLRQVLDRVMGDIERYGHDVLKKGYPGNYAAFRRHELAAAINRLRTLSVRPAH